MIRAIKIGMLLTVVAAVTAYFSGAFQRPGHAMTAEEHLAHIKAMSAAGDIHAGHALDEFARGIAQAAPNNPKLPADDMGVVARLASSPRKGEYVNVMVDGKPMRTWVVHPAGNGKAPVVVVIMEIFGLSDWIRGVADQLAAEGFIAVAPDLVSGLGPGGGGTDSAASRDDVVKLVRALTPEMTTARINAARAYAAGLPAANGKVATMGFCWGGGQSFRYA